MNRMMPPLGGRHLLQHGLEPLLEFAAVFRARDQRAHVEREQLLVVQALRHVAVDDAQRQPLDDRGLADAGLADQHRIVLGAARQHLDGAADFLVAADHRIELAVARGLGQVAGIFLQRVIGVFGRRASRRCGPCASASIAALRVCGVTPALAEDLAGLAVLLHREREQQPLDGDEAVAGLLAGLLGGVEHPRQRRIEIDLAGAAAGNLGPLGERRLDGGQRLARIAAGAVDQPRGEPFRVVEQHLQQMLGRELLMALALRERLGGLHETAGAVGIFFKVHVQLPRPVPAARCGAAKTSSSGASYANRRPHRAPPELMWAAVTDRERGLCGKIRHAIGALWHDPELECVALRAGWETCAWPGRTRCGVACYRCNREYDNIGLTLCLRAIASFAHAATEDGRYYVPAAARAMSPASVNWSARQHRSMIDRIRSGGKIPSARSRNLSSIMRSLIGFSMLPTACSMKIDGRSPFLSTKVTRA